MNTWKTLDRLILADFLVGVCSLIWSARSASPGSSRPAFVLWVLVCAATVVAWVGLLYRLRPARTLYAASWLGYLAWVAARGATVTLPFGTVLDLATGLVGGMILALVYVSDLRSRLRPFGDLASGDALPTR